MTWNRSFPLFPTLAISALLLAASAQAQSLKAQYKPAWGTTTQNQLVPIIDVVNAGTAPVTLSSVTVRYWYTADSAGKAESWSCVYTPRGCASVKGRVVPLGQAVTGADRYLELSFT